MLAFDSKDCLRPKIYQTFDIVTKEPRTVKEVAFYSPLGIGLEIIDNEQFEKECLDAIDELSQEFKIPQKRLMYDSYYLRKKLSHKVAIPFCDKLISTVSKYVKLLHCTYVVLPPAQFPYVSVGGYKSPAYNIRSADFLRKLQPMFSYISAWSYFALPRNCSELILDGFTSKQTHAWSALLNKTKPKIFPHGDECNVSIMMADIFAYLTDSKLYTFKKPLRRESIQEIWKPYGFEVDCHYLDYYGVPQYGWHSEDSIYISQYLARPMVFFLIDDLYRLQPSAVETQSPDNIENEEKYESAPPILTGTEDKTFRDSVMKMEPWFNVCAYAYYKHGAAQLFNLKLDMAKVQDGDTMVYFGNQSKAIAESFTHIYDIEVLSAKEIRKYVNRQKG